MNFFSSSFNAEKVLNDLRLSITESRSFESVDEFEQYLRNTDAALVAQLQKLEVRGNLEKKSFTGLNREARLSQMCARRGRNVTEPVEQLKGSFNKRWNSINLFRTDQQGPMRRLEECMEQGHSVCISLRGRNCVNSFIQAKIVAFDKHWNLLIRDGDESFKPSVRMNCRASKSMQITGPHQYSQSQCESREGKTETIWRRHLPCSLIRGDDVVLIFVSPRLPVKHFLR
ncbi:Sm protein [Loa loa]|nr:Sm protein [Loa loa]EFO16559.1 Sm protein [Loa loa]